MIKFVTKERFTFIVYFYTQMNFFTIKANWFFKITIFYYKHCMVDVKGIWIFKNYWINNEYNTYVYAI